MIMEEAVFVANLGCLGKCFEKLINKEHSKSMIHMSDFFKMFTL